MSGKPGESSQRPVDSEKKDEQQPSPYGDNAFSSSPFDSSNAFANPSVFGQTSNFGSSPQMGTANSSGNSTVAPNMIGDLFGMNQPAGIVIDGEFYAIPGGSLGGAPGANVGRQKFSENGNPVPHDRFWVDYSYFDQTRLYDPGIDVHRGTLGIEKTFFGGFASLEVRTPFASTVDSGQAVATGGLATERSTELGNLTLFGKALLSMSDYHTFGLGLGLTVPTASSTTVSDIQLAQFLQSIGFRPGLTPNEVLQVRNESFHLLPYVGGSFTPFQRLFVNWVLQLDVDLNGNEARLYSLVLDAGDTREVTDNSYLFLDVSIGYWLFRRPQVACSPNAYFIDGMAFLFEVHQNEALGSPKVMTGQISGGGGNAQYETLPLERLSTTNLTFGLTTLLGQHSTLTTAIVAPVDGSEQFDREFRLLYDYRF